MKNYLLVLEKRPFDYMPINISLLDIGYGKNLNTLKDIDVFTKAYTKDEIINSVIKANIVTQNYLDGQLVVVEIENNNQKYLHKYKTLTNDFINGFDLVKFIYENITNKNIMNSIIVKCSNLLKNDQDVLNSFKESINTKNIRATLLAFYTLPYEVKRELEIYIIDKYHNINKQEELIRTKAA